VQAIARLRAEVGSALPALIVTGDTAPDRLREASASGHPLIHKPLQPALLRAFLRNARHRRVAAESA
jgi:DNA-binding response OmpR family regulator